MTLRALIQIVPFGDENLTEDLYRVNISNTGKIRDLGFGNQICSYSVTLEKRNNTTVQHILGTPEWEIEQEVTIPEHNRRDGAVALVQTALAKLGG